MCLMDIYAQSHSRNIEVLPEDSEAAEFMVEDAAGQILLTIFNEVVVHDVSIQFYSASRTGIKQCFIQIHAQCSCESFIVPSPSVEHMKFLIEEGMRSLLKELFGQIKVDRLTLDSSLCNFWKTPALSQRII